MSKGDLGNKLLSDVRKNGSKDRMDLLNCKRSENQTVEKDYVRQRFGKDIEDSEHTHVSGRVDANTSNFYGKNDRMAQALDSKCGTSSIPRRSRNDMQMEDCDALKVLDTSNGHPILVPKDVRIQEKAHFPPDYCGAMLEKRMEEKKVRSPTYNQLTDPYHLPFCLDIYITKGSVRACIIHRVSSKVMVVAHSISKDMKFDLKSSKDTTACATIGSVLAQRAIADDIHNVVYTPRKGDKIEGKLNIVLQSIIDNGIDVKLKIKQKNPFKVSHKHVLQ